MVTAVVSLALNPAAVCWELVLSRCDGKEDVLLATSQRQFVGLIGHCKLSRCK